MSIKAMKLALEALENASPAAWASRVDSDTMKSIWRKHADALEGLRVLLAELDNASRKSVQKRLEAQQPATTEPVADGVPDGVHWFTVTQDGMPDFGEEVIGGFWYTDPWLKPDCATRFMWGQCRVVKDDHRDFKDGKRWQTFGPSHNDITHWARLKSPAHHTANHESQNDE